MRLKILVFFVLCSTLVSTQSLNKTINYQENEIIQNIHSFNSKTVICTYNKENEGFSKYRIYVYNQLGDILFFHNEHSSNPSQVFVGKDENIIIVSHKYDGKKDRIKSLEINDGTELWSVVSSADRYTISPSGDYLLTQASPVMGVSDIQVINLNNGHKTDLDLSFNIYTAEWIDNHRMVIINTKVNMEENNISVNNRDNEIKNINIQIKNLGDRLKENEITRDQYLKEVHKLQKQRKALISSNKMKNDGGVSKSIASIIKRGKRNIKKESELIIYNLQEQNIDVIKILNFNGKQYHVPPYSSDIETINVDSYGNIYVNAYHNGRELIKISPEFNLLKSYKIEKYSHLTKIIKNSEVIFRVLDKDQNVKILNENEGKFKELNTEDSFSKQIQDLNTALPVYNFDSGLIVNETLNKITFINGGSKK